MSLHLYVAIYKLRIKIFPFKQTNFRQFEVHWTCFKGYIVMKAIHRLHTC